MALIPVYFNLEELVCKDIYDKFGVIAWQFFDPRLIKNIDWIRRMIGKPIFINNWIDGGKFDERGYRCLQCSLVVEAIKTKRLYVSPHMLGQAVDFDVQGLVAEEVRQWLIKIKGQLPFAIRLENNVNWVHLDVQETGEKVKLFNP